MLRYVLIAALLAGCTEPFGVTHIQTSDEWTQEGAWAALQDTPATVDARKSFAHGSFGADFYPDDLAALADAELQFVRWHDEATEATFRIIQFEVNHVQVWVGEDHDFDVARELFYDIAPQILDADDAEMARLSQRLQASETYFDARPARDGMPPSRAFIGYGFSYERPNFERLYESLGGLDNGQLATTLGSSGWLPAAAQVTLQHGLWAWHFEMEVLGLTRGSASDQEILWVSPTDKLQYVHQGRDELSDAEATAAIKQMLRDVGLEIPARQWTWHHEAIQHGIGD